MVSGMQAKSEKETRFISWNVRGLGGLLKQAQIQEMLEGTDAQIVALQETKLATEGGDEVRDFLKRRFVVHESWVKAEARGKVVHRGGILMAVAKEMASWIRKVEERIPGYLMVVHMEEGKRKLAVINMYYPAYEPDGTKGRGALMNSVENALEETLREARGGGEMVVLLTDGNGENSDTERRLDWEEHVVNA
ncbi:hypothetical protein PAPYR_5439 [Paratrimastix pyriformis]|uniref:Uncharacterized protein n=1 Tax=Paratrimastix pyriformis TaxID=342808 RepID=A0ABQ8UHH0_9EUKA|nr:hypothetical protein PAPYR_5439 [Paratrimastix pyriformis]